MTLYVGNVNVYDVQQTGQSLYVISKGNEVTFILNVF